MAANLGGQPIFILKEGSQRTRGRDAQSGNIAAAKAVAGAVRTTLGPKGMDKMLVDTIGDVVITNDGVTILKEMDIEHPAAKMMVEVAKTQDDEVGDISFYICAQTFANDFTAFLINHNSSTIHRCQPTIWHKSTIWLF